MEEVLEAVADHFRLSPGDLDRSGVHALARSVAAWLCPDTPRPTWARAQPPASLEWYSTRETPCGSFVQRTGCMCSARAWGAVNADAFTGEVVGISRCSSIRSPERCPLPASV
jgi:hypothetical protein